MTEMIELSFPCLEKNNCDNNKVTIHNIAAIVIPQHNTNKELGMKLLIKYPLPLAASMKLSLLASTENKFHISDML